MVDRGRRAARRPDHHSHRRQGQRILPARLDRRPRAARQRHRLARLARSTHAAWPRRTSGTGRPDGCSGASQRIGAPPAAPPGPAAGGPPAARLPRDRHRDRGAPGARAARAAGGSSRATPSWRCSSCCSTGPASGASGGCCARSIRCCSWSVLYAQLDVLNRGGAAVHDALVQRWELALFGAQVSRVWWQAEPSALWSTVLHAAYFSYYFIVSIPAFYFLWRGDVAAVRRFVLTVMAAVRALLPGLSALSGRGALLRVSAPGRMVHRQSRSPPGLRHPRAQEARTAPPFRARTSPRPSPRRLPRAMGPGGSASCCSCRPCC